MRIRPALAALLLTIVAAGCAASPAGTRVETVSADGSESLRGVTLGTVGDAAHLHVGWPWIPAIGLCRRQTDGKDQGNVFLATIVQAQITFGFDHLVVTENGVERSLPGTILRADSRFGLYDPRYTEDIEVPISDDDVRRFVAAGSTLELRLEGNKMWIKVPPGPALEAALRDYRDHFLPASAASPDPLQQH